MFETSILTEIGRLFFKNVQLGDFGVDKPAAYQGLRPRILDHLVVTHEIACTWAATDEQTRRKLAVVAENSEREFVSLIRQEVGRERAASSGAAEGGLGANVAWLVREITDQTLRDRRLLD